MIKYVYGVNVVLEVLQSTNENAEKIFILKHKRDKRIKNILSLAKDRKAKVVFCEKDIFNLRFKQYPNNQGVVAEVSQFKYFELDEVLEKTDSKFFILLDSIQDQQNFGGIIRSAEFFGVNAIIFPKDRNARINETTAKVSSGALFHIPIVKVINLSHVIDILKENEFQIIASSPDGSNKFEEIDRNKKIALIFGNEEKGIRKKLLDKSDLIIGLKSKGITQSLNANCAAAIFIYEIQKMLFL